MAYEIILGRDEADRKQFGLDGAILLGRHYVKMGQVTSLSNNIYLDMIRSHSVFVCGKRGGGKSYTMGVIAEGISELPPEISDNLAMIIFDTMGVYWTMKYPNKQDEQILDEWGLKAKKLNVQIFTPMGFFKQFKEKGIPTDFSFSVNPSELSVTDWCLSFDIPISDPVGILIERIIHTLQEEKGAGYSIDDIIKVIQQDSRVEQNIKDAAENRFIAAKGWGLFSDKGTKLDDLYKGGQITIIDVSCYAFTPGAEGIRSLVIGLISQKIFFERMVARKNEEFEQVNRTVHYIVEDEGKKKQEKPLVWLIVDEAHEFLPNEGKTAASNALVTILREGRQPGISLVLASQQPGRIHTDVMTQSDIVIAHRVTAKLDVDALGMLMQTYMREGMDKELNNLPSSKGSAIAFDDVNERSFSMKIRPRFTWHGGSSPIAYHKKKEQFEL